MPMNVTSPRPSASAPSTSAGQTDPGRNLHKNPDLGRSQPGNTGGTSGGTNIGKAPAGGTDAQPPRGNSERPAGYSGQSTFEAAPSRAPVQL